MLQEPKGVSSGCPQTIEDQCQERITSDESLCTVDSLSNVSVASAPIIDTISESCLSESSNPSVLVPPTSSSLKRAAKESKLNPGAKIFSPSKLHHRAMTPAVSNGASISYMPGTYIMGPMTTAQEVNTSSFIHASVPVKLVPYDNVAVHHGSSDVPYVQSIVGQVPNRMQPVRYTGQYQNFQMGPAYIHLNPQNDVVQGAAGLSPATKGLIFTSQQMHLAKHQGNAPAQTPQLGMRDPRL